MLGGGGFVLAPRLLAAGKLTKTESKSTASLARIH